MDSLKIMFRPKKWENDVYAKIQNKNPNDIILEDIGDYDIYLGIMWKNFGTPTGKYKSGTEQEFRIALENYENTGKPIIKFYFSKIKFEIDEIEVGQLNNVKEFEDELKTKGILKYYNTLEEFRYMIFKELSECLKDEYEKLKEVEQ